MDAPCSAAAARVDATNLPSATREPSGTPRPPVKPASGGALRFPQTARVLRSSEFRAVYDNGTRLSGPLFAAFCLARPDPARSSARLGLTVPRAIGGSVVRNRIKRRIREAFRMHRSEFGRQWDIVVNPRRAALGASFPEIERALQKVIEKCGS